MLGWIYILGEIIFSKHYTNTNKETIVIDAFSEGIYIMNIEENGIVVYSGKIVKK
ncbi:T9SS type A sorting domain-containing protein [Aquimarina agarivorans]|uniref:T9SS type A sorting domain-containing protein n=1 Tax=Aquimarina agarivorans TaxID=980584 RepID=UPI0002DF2C48